MHAVEVQNQVQEEDLAVKAATIGLVRKVAFVPDPKANVKSAGALRVERHRQKKKEAGLVPVDLPVEVASRIKEQGLQSLLDGLDQKVGEVIKPVPVSDADRTLIELGRKVERLPRLVRRILGLM